MLGAAPRLYGTTRVFQLLLNSSTCAQGPSWLSQAWVDWEEEYGEPLSTIRSLVAHYESSAGDLDDIDAALAAQKVSFCGFGCIHGISPLRSD